MGACVMRLVVVSLTCLVFVNSFIMSSGPRQIVKVLGPTFLSNYGDWGRTDFCAHGAFATGYNLKVEPELHSGDDSALNAIELQCTEVDGNFGGKVSSTEGIFGEWGQEVSCQRHSSEQYFLTEFRIQVEGDQHSYDDTAANYIGFKCRSFSGERGNSQPLSWGVGHGVWGAFSDWYYCPTNSAICGIKTRVEGDQHHDDDTALNDLILFCCT